MDRRFSILCESYESVSRADDGVRIRDSEFGASLGGPDDLNKPET